MNLFADALAWIGDGAHWGGPAGIDTRILEHLWITFAAVGIAAVLADRMVRGVWLPPSSTQPPAAAANWLRPRATLRHRSRPAARRCACAAGRRERRVRAADEAGLGRRGERSRRGRCRALSGSTGLVGRQPVIAGVGGQAQRSPMLDHGISAT